MNPTPSGGNDSLLTLSSSQIDIQVRIQNELKAAVRARDGNRATRFLA
jgi:hypothetical protein